MMELSLVKEKDNKLLSRKRVTFEGVADSSTPSRLTLKDYIAKQVKKNPETVIIRHVYTRYGSRKIRVIAHVYDKADDIAKVEEKSSIKRNMPPKKESEEETEDK